MSKHNDSDAEFVKFRTINCFRIQHRKSGLGPYTHDDQRHLHFFHDSNCMVADIDDDIRPILRSNANVRFAFTSLEKCKVFMRNKKDIRKAGFEIVELSVAPLFVGKDQVVYAPEMSKRIQVHDY